MFEKFLSANVGDFKQRYEGTFGFYRDEKGKKMLAQLTEIGNHTCTFSDVRGLEYHLNVDAEKDIGFVFLPPKSGYFNTEQGAHLVQRIAARQFQRGVSSKNISITLLNAGGQLPQRVGFPILEKVYEKIVSVKDAVSGYNRGDVPSFALNNQFALDNAGFVWLLAEVIGKWERGNTTKFKLKLHDPVLFRTELSDAFKANNYPYEIN
jgi:hypothetical protein